MPGPQQVPKTRHGLEAKNPIPIVAFARKKFESGMDLAEAALEAARPR